MKQLIGLIVIVLALTNMGLAQVSGINKTPLPSFDFIDTEGFNIDESILGEEQPIMIFYFDPKSDECNIQAKLIADQIDSFYGISLVWISIAKETEIDKFELTHFGEYSVDNIYFIQDVSSDFESFFGDSKVLSVYVYNYSWLQVATFDEKQTAADLLATLDEEEEEK